MTRAIEIARECGIKLQLQYGSARTYVATEARLLEFARRVQEEAYRKAATEGAMTLTERAAGYLKLAEAATPGPWSCEQEDEQRPDGYVLMNEDDPPFIADVIFAADGTHDASFIAASHEAASIIRELLEDRATKSPYDMTIQELQAAIGSLQSILHYKVYGDPRDGVSP